MKITPLRGLATKPAQPEADIMFNLGVDAGSWERMVPSLPFGPEDATCGTEHELQAVVAGPRENVDLPIIIEQSNYFLNIIKRQRRGELPRRVLSDLESWLTENPAGVWENSWVRFPRERLRPSAAAVLEKDLLRDKANPTGGCRLDANRFFVKEEGRELLRIPVSYLLKLTLAEAVGGPADTPALVKNAGMRLTEHFLSDNTSPETVSMYVISEKAGEGLGRAAAAETGLRMLLGQLLVQYAGQRFGLNESGQRVLVYMAPHPPVRQRELNEAITDSFYRELFMNPCLSGWNKGEDKQRYMHLCHEVMSRARLNALAGLKEAGIVTSNLVVLPTTSNISLSNNGVHISLGSKTLSRALGDPGSGIGAAEEKRVGDLVIKFVEHFLPLFVGDYSAAPYRLDFADFHPERVLSFLPYQLDYTHLRMIWRRWKKKARLKVRPTGFRMTPFGPPLLDKTLSRIFGMRGDFVPDFRLLDYLAALMSTDQSPALDGKLGNQERLKKDLAELGVFDQSMATYLPYRQRVYSSMGFSGFEGRHYSLFQGLDRDLGRAVDLQRLVTALAFQFIAGGRLSHADIPDSPEIESERRQTFFAAAIGLPTFYVRMDTGNNLLRMLVENTKSVRRSRRYPGYWRVRRPDFRRALVEFICREGAALVEALGLEETMQDLAWRVEFPERRTAWGRLTKGITEELGVKDPLASDARDFNRAAESYYRETLRKKQLHESWDFLERELSGSFFTATLQDPEFRKAADHVLGGRDPLDYVQQVRGPVIGEAAREQDLVRMIHLVLLAVEVKNREFAERDEERSAVNDSSIYRAAIG